MKFRNLDADLDWTFGKGVYNYARQQEATKLNIRTRLLSWVNDCFFDMSAGIDWLNRLGDKQQRELLEQDIKRVITQSEDVIELVTFSTTLLGRQFSAEYTVRTIYSKLVTDFIQVGV